MNVAFLGLTITSSWGNGHATVFRSLVKALARRGHGVTFLERDKPWYAGNRDCPDPPGCRTVLYDSVDTLENEHKQIVADADVVVVGSYVPDGVEVGRWAQATAGGACCYYDIDTPVTLAAVRRGECEYLTTDLIAGYACYFSFTGGPTLDRLVRDFGSPRAEPLYCCVDPDLYGPDDGPRDVLLGYMGTHSPDRQPAVERLLLSPARDLPGESFLLVGPQYPPDIRLTSNVKRIEHLPPSGHRRFYNRQSFTLNVTRKDMINAGHAPSVRLFEAAACGTPIISDRWAGIDEVLAPGREILLADDAGDVRRHLREADRDAVGTAARRRVLAAHTADARAAEFEAVVRSLR